MRVLRGVGIGIGVALRLEDPLIKMFREADTNWFYCTRCGAYANPMRPSIAAYSNEMFFFKFPHHRCWSSSGYCTYVAAVGLPVTRNELAVSFSRSVYS